MDEKSLPETGPRLVIARFRGTGLREHYKLAIAQMIADNAMHLVCVDEVITLNTSKCTCLPVNVENLAKAYVFATADRDFTLLRDKLPQHDKVRLTFCSSLVLIFLLIAHFFTYSFYVCSDVSRGR